jgi:hypothetical protein
VSQFPDVGRRVVLYECWGVGREHHVDLEFVLRFDVDSFDQEFHKASFSALVDSLNPKGNLRTKTLDPLHTLSFECRRLVNSRSSNGWSP